MISFQIYLLPRAIDNKTVIWAEITDILASRAFNYPREDGGWEINLHMDDLGAWEILNSASGMAIKNLRSWLESRAGIGKRVRINLCREKKKFAVITEETIETC